MTNKKENRLHQTFPLTRKVLDRHNLSPGFDYPEIRLAQKFSSALNQERYPLTSAEVSAVGLMGKIFLKILESYQENNSPTLLSDLAKYYLSVEADAPNDPLYIYIATFPASQTYSPSSSIKDFILSQSQSITGIEALWKTIILITLANENSALKSNDGIFTDSKLWNTPEFHLIVNTLNDFFSDHPSSGHIGSSTLLELLREPSRAFPGSIRDQLEYIRQNWAHLIGEDYFLAILKSIDRFKEEQIRHPGMSKRAQDPLKYALASYESSSKIARFSDDLDWMPRVTLLAKNVFVWLDQLSKHYQRPIHKLDQIPDEELQKLSSWGLSGLWLIGVWERSTASQKIKQLCGNTDAVPSAYSLYDYTIAATLGGESAYDDLAARANSFNIRLAADMVPNHMGIYSKWIEDYPERFLSLDQSPYPNYSFNGPDLSTTPRFKLFLEDHYYDKSDAAVVFKRVDNQTQTTKYIYHGNDGTAMPWNDTAQLDFLRKDVREAVIQTIIQVAKKFPIIRFDAAMTLAKKHYQRLWFPESGSGGAIPTRSNFGLSKNQFNQLFPDEFWREVVDRISQEAPGTLLLAEAFWMMEGYFVRTLGMHRVYNSAFMHMMRDEENIKYRRLMINTLELDPEILKRYVNFMNNPDEETALAQFGSDGKYFGTCVLMVTMPGLPLFGHGQIEGYSEKYGMEYQRAYYQENSDQALINRHIREIFPLLHKRYLFAEVSNFFLYDFSSENSNVNDDVFAYSNKVNSEAALVIFHNKWGSASGRINNSTLIKGKSIKLFEGLGLNSNSQFILFRDQITNLEYIRATQDINQKGLHFELGSFQYHVFLDFVSVEDPSGNYCILEAELNGGGTPSIEDSLIKIKYTPLFNSIYELVQIIILAQNEKNPLSNDFQNKMTKLKLQIDPSKAIDYKFYQESLNTNLIHLLNIHKQNEIICKFRDSLYISFIFWLLVKDLKEVSSHPVLSPILKLLADKLALSNDIVSTNKDLIPKSISLLLHLEDSAILLDLTLKSIADFWFSSVEINTFINVHDHDGIAWFNKESFELLIDIYIGFCYFYSSNENMQGKKQLKTIPARLNHFSSVLHSTLAKSNYQVEKFKSLINELSIEDEV